jgi:hypothetical protein
VCDTILMKKMHPSLLLRPSGIDVLISCVRSGVRQCLSFVFKKCSFYSCEAGVTRSTCFAFSRSSSRVHVMFSGRSKYPSRKMNGFDVLSVCWLEVCDFLVPFDGWGFRFCQKVVFEFRPVFLCSVQEGLIWFSHRCEMSCHSVIIHCLGRCYLCC